MTNTAARRFYRAAWYAAAGWCPLPAAYRIDIRFDQSLVAWAILHCETCLYLSPLTVFVISAGPLLLLTVGHWITTGTWRFGWERT